MAPSAESNAPQRPPGGSPAPPRASPPPLPPSAERRSLQEGRSKTPDLHVDPLVPLRDAAANRHQDSPPQHASPAPPYSTISQQGTPLAALLSPPLAASPPPDLLGFNPQGLMFSPMSPRSNCPSANGPPAVAALEHWLNVREEVQQAQTAQDAVREERTTLQTALAHKREQLQVLRSQLEALEAECAHFASVELELAEREARLSIVTEQARDLAMCAVASPRRIELWVTAALRKLGTHRKQFEEYERLASRPSAWDGIIAKDIPRTLSCITVPGDKDEAAEERIRRVLRVWVARSEDEGFGCGYVQSMNFVCAIPCVLLESFPPHVAFGACCAALEEGVMPDVYASWPPLAGLLAVQEVFAAEMEQRVPRITQALDGCLTGFLGLLLPKWLMTLFAGVLPAPLLIRIWDEILSESSHTSQRMEASLAIRRLETSQATGGSQPLSVALHRTGGASCIVTLKWAMALIAAHEDLVVDAVESLDPMVTPREVVAFDVMQKAVARLSPDWLPGDAGVWDAQRIRSAHAQHLQRLREEVAGQRLSRSVAVDRTALGELRAEFDKLRGPLQQRRSVQVMVPPVSEDASDLGLIFASGSRVVLAVNAQQGLPALTGWQLRAVCGAALAPGADLSEPWQEWQVCRWEWESGRHGGYEPFDSADSCALEESWTSGKGRYTTRGLSFNSRDRILYTYDFECMQEKAHDTGKQRTIRRTQCTAGELWREVPASARHKGVELWFEASGHLDVYENQVFMKGGGWGPPKQGTVSAWTDATGNAVDLDAVQPPEACVWDGPWQVDRTMGGGAEGWLYAEKGFSGWFKEAVGERDTVRRRCWRRGYVSCLPPANLDQEEAPENADMDTIELEALAPLIHRFVPDYKMELLPNLFRLLDTHGSGRIGFYNLMVGVSMLEMNTVDGHLRLLHNLYDSDADGRMSKEETERLVDVLRTAAHARRVIGKQGAVVRSSALSRLGSASQLGHLRRVLDSPSAAQHRQRQTLLPPGSTVVISAEEGELFSVWWVHGAGRGEEQSAVELRKGYVRQSETQPAPHDADDDLDEDTFIAHLFHGKAGDGQIDADTWAQTGWTTPLFWRALSEAGVPIGQMPEAASSPAAPSFSLSPQLSMSGCPRNLPSPMGPSKRGGSPGAHLASAANQHGLLTPRRMLSSPRTSCAGDYPRRREEHVRKDTPCSQAGGKRGSITSAVSAAMSAPSSLPAALRPQSRTGTGDLQALPPPADQHLSSSDSASTQSSSHTGLPTTPPARPARRGSR
eukprot:TRINITY_DN1884_c0_g2_i1.p1 TRINITY_DN1884_c0_g2~~TRINITY_DN1884_c0_g2_i1.p1  ORF type:complete len:1261 (+),score=198.90 TRINITY_DN1884_c0_g2_i1:79-3861(+)